MTFQHLRRLRIGVALVFFVLILFLFLDFRDFGVTTIAGEVLYLQFVPSLLQFLDNAAMGTSGFILVLILTLLFGRVYCSFVCPLGIFQDLVTRLARKRVAYQGKKQRTYRFSWSRPHYFLWYAVLILTVLLFLAGTGLVLNLLDPFSSFGAVSAGWCQRFSVPWCLVQTTWGFLCWNNWEAMLFTGSGCRCSFPQLQGLPWSRSWWWDG